jgi:two-component system sensor histidine kinase KdpD
VQLGIDHDCNAGASRIRVIDHGPGVPAEMYEALFRGFHRLDDRGAGVGLGLAVSHGFVEAMGGLLVPSETPGGGLTMDIVLPSEDQHNG